MNQNGLAFTPFTLLVAEDDPDNRLLAELAFVESRISGTLFFVEDGEQLLNFLFHRAEYAEVGASPRPSVLFLDLNMPKKDGREALYEIKQDPELKNLPVVVLTTSDWQEDKDYCAGLGVSDYVSKPDNVSTLIDLMKDIQTFSQNRV